MYSYIGILLLFCEFSFIWCQEPKISCHDEPLPSQTWINDQVLPVLNQKPTNACYAFVGADILGYSAFYDYNLQFNLSQQQIIDCSWRYGNRGIYGGLLSYTFTYVNSNPLAFEENYQYDGADTQDCGRGKPINGHFTVKDRYFIPKGDKKRFLGCLSAAPLVASIYLDANGKFRDYKNGILSYECPKGAMLLHYVIVVGYTVFNNEPVIIIKNTGGTEWGYAGYGFVSLKAANPLCIYDDAVRILGKPV